MMKNVFLLGMLLFVQVLSAQIYSAKDGATEIKFHSKAPLEDIEATNKSAIIVLSPAKNEIQFKITIIGFKFKNSLMEEHFNENYMESNKFPHAVFKGKINEAIDYTKDGDHKVTVSGKMEIHGVTKDVTLDGTLVKKGEEISIKSAFQIKVADYNIKVPSMYVKNIAEIVDVNVSSTLAPFQKK